MLANATSPCDSLPSLYLEFQADINADVAAATSFADGMQRIQSTIDAGVAYVANLLGVSVADIQNVLQGIYTSKTKCIEDSGLGQQAETLIANAEQALRTKYPSSG